MSFHNKAIILTGATSALGQATAKQLSKLGTQLTLVDRSAYALKQLQQEISQQGGEAFILPHDFQSESAAADVIANAQALIGQIDILINLTNCFNIQSFDDQPAGLIAQEMYHAAIIPMLMCHAVIPSMLSKQSGKIVNVGNVYGSLGLAELSSSAANAGALMGFTQSLSREYKSEGIKAAFIGVPPIKTALLDGTLLARTKAKNLSIVQPAILANQLIDAVHHGKTTHTLALSESWLVWLNKVAPILADRVIRQRYST